MPRAEEQEWMPEATFVHHISYGLYKRGTWQNVGASAEKGGTLFHVYIESTAGELEERENNHEEGTKIGNISNIAKKKHLPRAKSPQQPNETCTYMLPVAPGARTH